MIAACIAVAEASRGLHGGPGFDVLAFGLGDDAAETVKATGQTASPPSATLR